MKKPYASPQIIRVQLNPEQAVLCPCSTLATSIEDLSSDECTFPHPGQPAGCRVSKNNEDDGDSS